MAMMLHKSSGRSFRRRRSTVSNFCEINVTPLVDVMLVLLIIFMVAAPMLTVGVPVDLPKTQAAQLNDQIEPLVVSIDASGKSFLQETPLEGDELIARLMAITGSNPEARIFVRGDKSNNYGRVMEVMGLIAAAGFSKVSLIAEMPTTAAKKPAAPQLQAKGPSPQQNPVLPAAPKAVIPPKAGQNAVVQQRPQVPASGHVVPKPSGQPATIAQKTTIPAPSTSTSKPRTGPGTR
jgi:biopolymer transport protein TolR